ncbi:hypothetical protein [Schlesneria sp. T3-172]|uniref:hypothetical protein n=1 Tax=Schlesneria sphaerica TaxID=3373610 RepID=UPI0037CBAD33
MADEVNPRQALFLLRLLTQPEGFYIGKTKPELSAHERKTLEAAGLIHVSKQKESPKARAALHATLTEKGWKWAETHLDATLPTTGTAGLVILSKVLQLLKAHVSSGAISLATFFTIPETPGVSLEIKGTSSEKLEVTREEASSGEEIRESAKDLPDRSLTQTAQRDHDRHAWIDGQESLRRIQEEVSSEEPGELSDGLKRRLYDACFQIAGDGVYGVRIRLADLRSRLADVPRPELDNALRELEQSEAASIMPLDDPREIRTADEEAALSNSQGKDRHILYLSNPR